MSKVRAIAFVALTAGLTVVFTWRPSAAMPSSCMSRNLLGVSCPGCGMTRSVTSAAHGEFAASLRLHAFGPFVLAAGLIGWGLLAATLVTDHDYLPDINEKKWTYVIVGSFVLLVVYWLIRLILRATPP